MNTINMPQCLTAIASLREAAATLCANGFSRIDVEDYARILLDEVFNAPVPPAFDPTEDFDPFAEEDCLTTAWEVRDRFQAMMNDASSSEALCTLSASRF